MNQKQTYTKPNQTKEWPTLLDCPQCNSFISAQDINDKKHLAKCSHCDHVFHYDTEGFWDPFGPPLETQPEGIEVLRLQSLLELRVKHIQSTDRSGLGILLFFSLIWNLALLPFIFFIFSSGQLQLLLFISLHLFAGISMIWDAFGKIFNQTIVEVNQHEIQIKTTPFAWPGKKLKRIPVSQIQQLFVTKVNSKKSPQSGRNFSLQILLQSGKKMMLLSGLDERTMLYLEDEVEKYLGIQNRAVR